MVTLNDNKIDVSTIPEFIVDSTIKNLVKEGTVFYADGFLYKDGDILSECKQAFVGSRKDIDGLTHYLFGEDFIPINYSNDETVEYILEQYEFNLSEIVCRCPYTRYTFSYKNRQLVLCIYFTDTGNSVSSRYCFHKYYWIIIFVLCILCYVVIWTATNS